MIAAVAVSAETAIIIIEYFFFDSHFSVSGSFRNIFFYKLKL